MALAWKKCASKLSTVSQIKFTNCNVIKETFFFNVLSSNKNNKRIVKMSRKKLVFSWFSYYLLYFSLDTSHFIALFFYFNFCLVFQSLLNMKLPFTASLASLLLIFPIHASTLLWNSDDASENSFFFRINFLVA